jgi:hypothetical protein
VNIFNINLGHQSNSSSDHNLIFVPTPVIDCGTGSRDFGWNFFTAASPNAKLDYLALILRDNLQRAGFSAELIQAVVNAWCATNTVQPDNYIDHQSVWMLPMAWEGVGVDYEFFDDLKAHLLTRGVVILGGNDNDRDTPHPL